MCALKQFFQPAYIKQYQHEDAQATAFAQIIRNHPIENPLRLESIKVDLVNLVKSHIPFRQKWDTLQFVANRLEHAEDTFKLVIAFMDSRRDAYGVDHMDLNVPVQFKDPAYIARNYLKKSQNTDAHLALLETAFACVSELAPQYQYDAAKIISNHAPIGSNISAYGVLAPSMAFDRLFPSRDRKSYLGVERRVPALKAG